MIVFVSGLWERSTLELGCTFMVTRVYPKHQFMLYVHTWWCWDAAVWSCDCWDVRVVYNPISSLLYHGLMLLLYHSWDSFARLFYVSVQPWITYWLLLRCSHGLKLLLCKLVILIDVRFCISTYTFGASLLAALSVVLQFDDHVIEQLDMLLICTIIVRSIIRAVYPMCYRSTSWTKF